MLYTLRELECKDVVNLCDGKFLGRICDLEFDGECGKITAVYLMPHGSFWMTGREEIRVPWENIKCIGEDAVLMEFQRECDCGKRKNRRNNWWSV